MLWLKSVKGSADYERNGVETAAQCGAAIIGSIEAVWVLPMMVNVVMAHFKQIPL